MSSERSLGDRRAELDHHIETALKTANRGCLGPALAIMRECEDRMYGQLLAVSYDSMADSSDTEPVFSAATAVELLRGYCRLRDELLLQINDEITHSLNRDPIAALLAGDYLYAAAYSALGEVKNTHLGVCFETFATVSETMIEALYTTDSGSISSAAAYCSFIDKTAGTIGQGAAVIGATLAGVDSSRRDCFAKLGRGFGTGYQIQRTLDSDAGTVRVNPAVLDDQQIYRHGEQRLQEANQALQKLSSSTDADSLQAFVEGTLSS